MKISIEAKIGIAIVSLLLIIFVGFPLICGSRMTEDQIAIRKAYPSVLETGIVEKVLTNYEGISLVRVGHGKSNGFSRFAFTMDSVTNGTPVKLVQMSCDDSTTSMNAPGAFRFNCRFAVRITVE